MTAVKRKTNKRAIWPNLSIFLCGISKNYSAVVCKVGFEVVCGRDDAIALASR